MGGGGLEVKGDVRAGLSSVEGEVEVGGGATEGRCVPVVSFKDEQEGDVGDSTRPLDELRGEGACHSRSPSHRRGPTVSLASDPALLVSPTTTWLTGRWSL